MRKAVRVVAASLGFLAGFGGPEHGIFEIMQGHVKPEGLMIAAMGPEEIVLTHRDGLLVYAGGQFHEAGFFPRELVGRSGRGDTSVAAYVSRRLGASPAEATTWAAAVVSLKLEAEGPFRREIREVENLIGEKYDS